ncbi:MAG: hypothetical protein AB8F94_10280 [Saprospiraceae bacterium]
MSNQNKIQESLNQSLANLKEGIPLQRMDLFYIFYLFPYQSQKDQFILQVKSSNEKLAETLIIFRNLLIKHAKDKDKIKEVVNNAIHHYIVNTDGIIPEGEAEDRFDVFEAANQYAKSIHVILERDSNGDSLLSVDGKKISCPAWGIVPNWSAAWSLRNVGPIINRVRYGRDDIMPSHAFEFNSKAEGHTLENAMSLADYAHLAYFGPKYVEGQLKLWGYDTFRWIEDKKTDTQAFVAGKDDFLIVCFRGTSSGADALADLKFLKTDAYGGKGRVHRGFKGSLDSVWSELEETVKELGKDKPLFICGHSLGAALSLLSAYRFAFNSYNVEAVYTYGSPRVGNKRYKEAFNDLLEDKTFIHINNKDIVTRIPLRILGYRHMGNMTRVFDEKHEITETELKKESRSSMRSAGGEVEIDFEDLSPQEQEEVMAQAREAQASINASTNFLSTPPELLTGGNYRSDFETGAMDEHGMSQYLFKFGCAIVSQEWKRMEEEV